MVAAGRIAPLARGVRRVWADSTSPLSRGVSGIGLPEVRIGLSGPTAITWLLVPTRVHNPNVISIGSSGFVKLPVVSNEQTH